MVCYLEKIKDLIIRKKKVLIKSFSILTIIGVVLVASAGGFIYNKAKRNINYSVDEAKEIALQAVNGEVVKVEKSIEVENLSFEYEYKIKDSKNILRKVTVDSNLGVITDIDNYYD